MMTASRAAADRAAELAIVEIEPLDVDTATARARHAALEDSVTGSVGLEIETHLVDLDSVAGAMPWDRVDPMPALVRAAAGRSAVTMEPGGQLELSGPPAPDVTAAVIDLRRDMQRVRLALAELGLGAVHLGADPLRASRRVNPRPRYLAMEQHYAATGRSESAAVMMNSTAALQVNLDAGPQAGWSQRVARAHRLGPTMLAISACSPWLHGRDTGWKSARQRAWAGLDPRTSGAVPGCVDASGTDPDPATAWARYALRAPVAFVRTECDDAAAVTGCVPFEQWAAGTVRLDGRLPTAADLDLHLTTLFPPVRLRGYLELRYLDMSAPRWWPAIAAVVTTLMDDPVASNLASEATEQSSELWTEAARDGLGDAVLADSARRCLAIAADRVPADLVAAVADLAELVESGRCPGDLLSARIAEVGPHAAFEELAHA
jgi:glutamate--cysteine ligase